VSDYLITLTGAGRSWVGYRLALAHHL